MDVLKNKMWIDHKIEEKVSKFVQKMKAVSQYLDMIETARWYSEREKTDEKASEQIKIMASKMRGDANYLSLFRGNSLDMFQVMELDKIKFTINKEKVGFSQEELEIIKENGRTNLFMETNSRDFFEVTYVEKVENMFKTYYSKKYIIGDTSQNRLENNHTNGQKKVVSLLPISSRDKPIRVQKIGE